MKKAAIAIIVVLVLLIAAVVVWALTASSRTDVIAGNKVGSVIVNGKIPLRIRYAAGGISPTQRAEKVARRLQEIGDYQPNDVATGYINGQFVVLIKGELIATADSLHATANHTSPARLALTWRDNFRNVVRSPATPGGAGGGPAPMNTATKLVPIIGVGTGARVGVALVSGESAQVENVKAVAQIEGVFEQKARVRALVPIGTEDVNEGIERVPRTNVSAYADVRL